MLAGDEREVANYGSEKSRRVRLAGAIQTLAASYTCPNVVLKPGEIAAEINGLRPRPNGVFSLTPSLFGSKQVKARKAARPFMGSRLRRKAIFLLGECMRID